MDPSSRWQFCDDFYHMIYFSMIMYFLVIVVVVYFSMILHNSQYCDDFTQVAIFWRFCFGTITYFLLIIPVVYFSMILHVWQFFLDFTHSTILHISKFWMILLSLYFIFGSLCNSFDYTSCLFFDDSTCFGNFSMILLLRWFYIYRFFLMILLSLFFVYVSMILHI